MLEHTPLGRLSILEKDGRLVVIDRITGAAPATAAQRMAAWDAKHASQPSQSAVTAAQGAPKPAKQQAEKQRTPNAFPGPQKAYRAQVSLGPQKSPQKTPQKSPPWMSTPQAADQPNIPPDLSLAGPWVGRMIFGLFISLFLFPMIGGAAILVGILYIAIATKYSVKNISAMLQDLQNPTKKGGE